MTANNIKTTGKHISLTIKQINQWEFHFKEGNRKVGEILQVSRKAFEHLGWEFGRAEEHKMFDSFESALEAWGKDCISKYNLKTLQIWKNNQQLFIEYSK